MDFCDINGQYKQIRGFQDYYITEFGEVYSTRKIGIGKTSRLHKLKPKNPGDKSKYLNIILCRDDGQFTKSIHQLVAEHFVDGYFEGAVVNHKDGNNRNNNASNLEWTTQHDNVHKSYITSGMSAKRNYKEWSLYNPAGELIGVFYSHTSMENYVKQNGLDASPSQLTKDGNSRGYCVIKKGRLETVTTIRKE